MKVLCITSCRSCPYYCIGSDKVVRCEDKWKELLNPKRIPDWCRLYDAETSKKLLNYLSKNNRIATMGKVD